VLAFGQTLNRTIYAALFGVFGTSFNTGGEAGTDFRIPDMRGRFFAGLDNMGGVAAGRIQAYATATTVGTVGGNEQPHQHAHTANSASSGSPHTHSFSGTTSGVTDITDTNHFHAYSGTTSGQSNDHSHSEVGGVLFAFGSGGDPAATNGTQTGGASADHTHSYSGNTAYQSATGFGNYQHAHSFSVGVSGAVGSTNLAHNHGITVDAALSGASGNIPPVMFGNWCIRAF
jgi:microcystin-dependent protein